MVTLLLEYHEKHDVSVSPTNDAEDTPLHLACNSGNLAIAEMLLNAGGSSLSLSLYLDWSQSQFSC